MPFLWVLVLQTRGLYKSVVLHRGVTNQWLSGTAPRGCSYLRRGLAVEGSAGAILTFLVMPSFDLCL